MRLAIRVTSGALIVAALVCVTWLSLLPSAALATVVRSFPAGRYEPLTGPVLAGDRTVWAARLGSGHRLLERRAGRTATTRSSRAGRGSFTTVELMGSPFAVLVQEALIAMGPSQVGGDSLGRSSTLVSRAMSPGLQPLGPGCYDVGPPCLRNSAIHGSVVLSPAPAGSPAFEAQIRDLAQPESAVRVPNIGQSPSVDGSVAAWVTANLTVIIYDWRAQRELYRINDGGGVIDVQANGSVAFITGGGRLAWASAAEPYAHQVSGVPRRSVYDLDLQDDAIVFLRDAKGSAGRAVYAARLGSTPRLLVSGVKGFFDFDGSRVVWGERSCSEARIASAPYAQLLRKPVRRARSCPLRLAERLRAGRKGRLFVVPKCNGFRSRCAIEVQSLRSARTYRVGGVTLRKGSRVGATPKNIEPASHKLQVTLTRRARAVLRRRPIRVTMRATIDESATVGESAGVDETRSGRFVVRRLR